VFLVALVQSRDDPFGDNTYQKLSRGTKLNRLWAAIVNNTNSLDYYGLFDQSQCSFYHLKIFVFPNFLKQEISVLTLDTGQLFLENMELSFNTNADDMPHQYIGNLFERKKLIHTVRFFVPVLY
jgi:hypothetical protein